MAVVHWRAIVTRRSAARNSAHAVDGRVSAAHVRPGSIRIEPLIPPHASRLRDMERRQVVRFLGAALALPFLPRSAAAAIELGEQLHLRIDDAKGDVAFRTL